MNDADSKYADIQIAADILAQQKPDPARDNKEHHAARVSAQDDVESKPIHGGKDEGKDGYGVRHGFAIQLSSGKILC